MDIYENIDKELSKQGKSRRKLAIAAGIPPSTFQSMMERKRGLSVENLRKIAEVLNLKWYDLLEGFEKRDIEEKVLDEMKYELGTITVRNGKIIEVPYEKLLEEAKKTGKMPKWDEDYTVFANFLELNDAGQFVALQTVLEIIDKRLKRSNTLKFKYFVELLQKEAYDSIRDIATPDETNNEYAFEALNEVYRRVQELTQVPSYQKNNEQD